MNSQCAAACPCKKLGSAKWKIDKHETLGLLGTVYSDVITQYDSCEQDIQGRLDTAKRDKLLNDLEEEKEWKTKIFEDASVETTIKRQNNEQMSSRSPF